MNPHEPAIPSIPRHQDPSHASLFFFNNNILPHPWQRPHLLFKSFIKPAHGRERQIQITSPWPSSILHLTTSNPQASHAIILAPRPHGHHPLHISHTHGHMNLLHLPLNQQPSPPSRAIAASFKSSCRPILHHPCLRPSSNLIPSLTDPKPAAMPSLSLILADPPSLRRPPISASPDPAAVPCACSSQAAAAVPSPLPPTVKAGPPPSMSPVHIAAVCTALCSSLTLPMLAVHPRGREPWPQAHAQQPWLRPISIPAALAAASLAQHQARTLPLFSQHPMPPPSLQTPPP